MDRGDTVPPYFFVDVMFFISSLSGNTTFGKHETKTGGVERGGDECGEWPEDLSRFRWIVGRA